MRIQHNIMAMNAYRNYTNNVSAMKANLEKLSSGYKINRAGDDAAGLAISEKMRAQITGLETAQKNAKDGISLVQTAEGALTEVHDMLNRMVELASQSANGTYDNTTDRAQMQKEIEQLKSEINRIADSSNFNGINLLDGSMANGVTAGRVGSFDLPEVGQTLGVNSVLHVDEASASDVTRFGVDFADTEFKYSRGDKLEVSIGSNVFTLEVGASAAAGTLKAGDIANKIAQGGDADITVKLNGKAMPQGGANTVKFGDETFSMEVDGKGNLIFKSSTATDFKVNLDVKVKAESGTGTAIALTDLTSTHTAGQAVAAGNGSGNMTLGSDGGPTAAKLAITVEAFDAPGKQVYTLGNKTFEIETTGTMTATAVANALKAKIDEVGGPQGFNVTVNAGKVELTATTAGSAANADLTGWMGLAAGANKATIDAAVTSTIGKYGQYAISATAAMASLGSKIASGNATAVELTFGSLTVQINGLSSTTTASEFVDKIATKINGKYSDANGGKYTASVGSDGKIYLTASNMAADTDGFGGAITGKVIEGPAKLTGDRNVSTIQPNVLSEADKPRLASTVIKLEKSMVKDGASVTIGNKEYTFTTDKANAGKDGFVDISGMDSSDLDFLTKATIKLADAAKDNGVWTVGEVEAGNGKITLMEATNAKGEALNATGDTVNGKEVDLTTLEGIAATLGYKGADTVGNGLTLQIGDTSDDYNKLTVSIQDMHTESLGIADLDIGTQEGAAVAIDKIKAAINQVSDVRGTLGATQNRLDHTINNLSVMTENIQDAESTIRDTDVAEEMMAYTKNNILIQSAQAMLAQANQVPQGVLQLLQ